MPPEPTARAPAREEGMVLAFIWSPAPVQTGSVSRIPDPPHRRQRGRPLKVFVMKVSLLFTLLLASLSARAELIEAQGSAAILGGDEVYAREQATRDALRLDDLGPGRQTGQQQG